MPNKITNILVTGTPGVGKTTFCKKFCKKYNFRHIELSKIISEKKLYNDYDFELESSIFDENLVRKELNKIIHEIDDKNSKYAKFLGNVIDFHTTFFMKHIPLSLIIVLRTKNDILYDRLLAKEYPKKKISENIECEIFQTVYDEVVDTFRSSNDSETEESFDDDDNEVIHNSDVRIVQLDSNHPSDIQSNILDVSKLLCLKAIQE